MMCFALAHRHGKYTKAVMSEGGCEGDVSRCSALLCRIQAQPSSKPQEKDGGRRKTEVEFVRKIFERNQTAKDGIRENSRCDDEKLLWALYKNMLKVTQKVLCFLGDQSWNGRRRYGAL
jgi:hypothetical protein